MKAGITLLLTVLLISCSGPEESLPLPYREVDHVIWIVSDIHNTINAYKKLGFSQISEPSGALADTGSQEGEERIMLAAANLGGARIIWIQPPEGSAFFRHFTDVHGPGAMSLVHRFNDRKELNREIKRLKRLEIPVLKELTIRMEKEKLVLVLMDTEPEGKYILGLTEGTGGSELFSGLSEENRHGLQINQYAFAIRDPEPISRFWNKLGMPGLRIVHPELGQTKYYGELTDHKLIQGWQNHGKVAYEWCIPVQPPIVYEDHILKHGEGIHHLAFTVGDMDEVLEDFTNLGYVVSMGGTWGESGMSGSGRYEYIDLEEAGGLTMELLWSYK